MRTQDLQDVVTALVELQTIAYPTETFYGLGCLGLEPTAIDRLATLKQRSTTEKPYPLIIGALEQLPLLVSSIPEIALSLIERHWPGPLTLVLPAREGLDPRIVGEQGGVALRLSSHPLVRQLCVATKQPLISTSANLPGMPPPKNASEVEQFFEEILILDDGASPGGAPSTILDLTQEPPLLLREGAIAAEDLS